MAITLNLQHTFNSRVVFTSADIEEARKEMERVAGKLQEALDINEETNELSAKQVAGCKVSVKMLDELLELDDEALVFSLVTRGLRKNFRDDLEDTFKHLNITRCSPVQSKVV